MTKGFTTLILSAALAFVGCNSEKPAEDNKGGIEINAPGTNIKIDPENGVEVDAPGTKIRSDSDGNTSVDAPGVDADIKDE